MTIITTTEVSRAGEPLRDLLIFDMALREARCRSKKRNPPAHWLLDVLGELGLKIVTTTSVPA